MKYEILLADDDDSVRLVLHKALTRAGHSVKATDNAETLLKWAEAGQGDIVVTDVMMGGREVFDSLPQLTAARPKLPVIIISANNTVNTALKSGQHRVFEYVPKPFDLDDVTNAVARAGQSVNPRKTRPNVENRRLPMIGRSAVMQPVFRAVSRFAAGNLPVLVRGAVGSGKDLVARLLHDGGARVDRPFLRTTDFESTSLTLQKVNGGDIYIDEIGELSMHQQERLLALMNEAEMIPQQTRPRVISATRKDLRDLVEAGNFRDDLLFRINVAEIKIPDLAERDRDTYELAEAFLGQASPNQTRRFETEALDVLHRHKWTGNVRELENLVRRLAVLYSDDVITADMVLQEFSKDLPPLEKAGVNRDRLHEQLEEACRTLLNASDTAEESSYNTALAWVERPLIVEALRLTGGNRAKAAEKLGIHRNTLRTRLKSLEIS
ncbi:nitrogen regulation protein NR(I) [Litorimonas cladophorae]|uniref:DNA-binding transcriptional regulator NtrC n=1 Tax=Litorimonas cladophorae TaxID=1220491 RepID=A0A918KCI4_9PROT|nr:sigma 54-interacting transcriptional regulator [Litorimonas cladophorae]GGX58003.1 nitrogen regulation protein NR(I) [Litorimonas cladophorae]